MPDVLNVDATHIDFSHRAAQTSTVVGSPATNAETVVCSTPAFPAGYQPAVTLGVFIWFQVAYTVGTSGASAQYRIRQGVTAGSGTIVFNSGATTAGIAATNLVLENIIGFDTAPGTLPGQQYSLTLTIGSGAAASTVSAVVGFAYVI